jgi:bifunctional DNase/RNase
MALLSEHSRKWVIAGTFTFASTTMSCAAHESTPASDAPPAASGSAAPAPSKRRESKEPGTKDPSIKPPNGYKRMALGGIAPTPAGNAVVLMDEQGRRGLLVRTDGDAPSIALRVDHGRDRTGARPLLGDVVRKMGADVVCVRVDRVEDDTFHVSLTLSKGGELVDIDTSPDEALALAFGRAVPVFVSETVLSQAGIALDRFDFRKVREPDPSTGTSRTDEVEL